MQETVRRTNAGTGRDDYLINPELLRQTCRVQRGGAAGCDERASCRVFAILDRVNARGAGHGFVDDLGNTGGG